METYRGEPARAEADANRNAERYFWGRFSSDVQSRMERIRLKGGVIPLYRWDRFVLPESAGTNAEIDFFKAYERYRLERIGPGEYQKMIDEFADVVMEKMHLSGVPTDAFVAIPTRKEISTSHAVGVIDRDFSEQGGRANMRPYFLVLHNDVEEPDKDVWGDLMAIRSMPNVSVFDMKVSNDFTIGEVRAILADVAFEVSYRIGQETPIICGDADIMDVKPGTYRNMVEAYRSHPEAWFVTGTWEFDPRSVKNDAGYAAMRQIEYLVNRIDEEYLPFERQKSPPGINGTCFLANPRRLVALGGIPRVSLGEDHVLAAFSWNIPGANVVIPSASGKVYISGDRAADAFRNANLGDSQEREKARYVDWEGPARRPRPEVSDRAIDPEEVSEYVGRVLQYVGLGGAHYVYSERGVRAADRYLADVRSGLRALAEQYGIPLGTGVGQIDLSPLDRGSDWIHELAKKSS